MTKPLRIGPYEAGEFVARDAHASVCRVVDPADDRILTAKLYAPTGTPDARLLSRWHEEFANEAARLMRHARDLVPIEANGRAGDLAWVVMDNPVGEFLEDILGDQPINNDLACAILGRMAAALDRLHVGDLVHRSLKPSNVVISDEGLVLFLDTLLLGRFAEAVVAGSLPLDRLACAAPEAVLGYRQRAASNQYSLAVIAYRALTGSRLYAAGNAIDYAYACLYQEASAPSSRLASFLPAVDAIIARALAKHPDDRYPTCTAFVDDLRAALRKCEAVSEPELAVPDPDASAPPAWFESPARVLELVPEPLPDPPPPLRAASEQERRSASISSSSEVRGSALDDRRFRVASSPDERAVPQERVAPAVDGVDEKEVQRAPDIRSGRAEVVMPTPHEFDEFVAAPLNLPARRSMRARLRALREGTLRFAGKLTSRVRRSRVPDHLMREAYLADWRGEAQQLSDAPPEPFDAITPEWRLTVQPAMPGWLRVDGRYAGPAPAEISILGRAGKRVLVELMRDGVAVATTDLKLHPLMDKVWEPQEA